MPSKKKKYNARFPAGRIKKIMQSDEEVGKVAQAVPIIISRTLELFVESLLQKTLRITTARNAKTLSPSHMRQCIMSENRFDFLRELVKNVPDINVAEEQHQQQYPQAASTSSAGGRRPSPDSDDDVEFVSGNSTPTSSPAAAAAFALPTDLSSRTFLAAASVMPSTSNGSGHKRNAVGDLVAAPAQQQPPTYFSGLQPMSAPPSPYPTVASHSQQSLDLSAVAAERSAPSSSIAANYYTEIDTNTTNTTVAAVPQPQQQQPALLRSASTPAAASNYYANANNPTTSLTPTLQAAQPPVINFDFSKGLTNSSILYTAPSVVAQPQPQQQQPQVPTTIVNVAIDQLTQTPLVKIDYSQLNFDTPSATISTPSLPTPQAVVVATTPSLPPPAPDVVKPRRGRPPKVRPILTVGPVGQTLPAAPLSAPVRACAPYTPPTAEDYGRSAASSSSSSSSTSLSSPALYKYQKSTKTFVRSSSSSSGSKNHHHHQPGDASASTSSVTPAAAPLLMASPASMLAPPPLSLGIAAGSCLDMDEDYDNI